MNSLLMPFKRNFYSTRFKLKLILKQYAPIVNKRCVVYILAKCVRSQTVSLKFRWILLNKGYKMLNNIKNLR